jgi:two-component system, OmpR family, sensor kinase
VTLRLRLLLVLVGIVAAGLVVSDVVTYSSLQSFLVARLAQQLRDEPGTVQHALQFCLQQEQEAFTSCSLPGGTNVEPGTYGQLRNADGQVLISACFFNGRRAHDARVPAPLPVSSSSSNATTFVTTKTGCGATSYEGVAVDENFIGGSDIVIVALPLTEENQTLGHLLLVELLVSLAVLAGLGGISWWVVRRGLRPLDEMATTAGAIASGDLSQRVPHADTTTEVGRLGVALNTMLNEIETAFAARSASEERLRRFLADASHELRTPLTSIRGYAEIFDRGARDRPEDLATSMRHIRSEANRMSELVDDLLLLARLDRERPLAHEQVELTTVAAAAVDAARVKDPDRAVTFAPPAPVVVVGDASRLRQVVDNLVDNAMNHTPPGTPIAVDVGAEGATALLTVADRGPGIAPADRDRIFEPFHRADPSRARATGGVGLGLAIVSAIAQAHGGTVGVDSDATTGATFWVRLPLAPAAAPPPVPALPPLAGPPPPPPSGPPVSQVPPPAVSAVTPAHVGDDTPVNGPPVNGRPAGDTQDGDRPDLTAQI